MGTGWGGCAVPVCGGGGRRCPAVCRRWPYRWRCPRAPVCAFLGAARVAVPRPRRLRVARRRLGAALGVLDCSAARLVLAVSRCGPVSAARRSAAGLSSPPFIAPRARVVVGKALWFGAARWSLRESSRAFSGAVLWCGFPCFSRAARFAAGFGFYCGFPLCVRRCRSRGGVVWAVSVPVDPAGMRPRPARILRGPAWFVRRG